MIRLGNTGLFICRRHERPRLSRSEALEALRRAMADPQSLYALRALAGVTASAGHLGPTDDQRIAEELAARISTGDLILFGELIPMFPGGLRPREPEGEGPAPPQRARATPPPPPSTDPSVFPPNADLAALSDALESAAQAGAPFCDT